VYNEWTPDDGQRNCPKHVEVHFLLKINFGEIGASVGFNIKKFVTMHDHMNVKNLNLCFSYQFPFPCHVS